MAVRRPSYLAIAVISAIVLVSLYLVATRRDGTPIPSLGAGRVKALRPKLTDDIYNSTLGVSHASLSLHTGSNLQTQFEKIFVIGLPSRTDRRDGIVLEAALSNIDVEFIDGVQGKDVPDKAIPTGPGLERMPDPNVGSWRAHINAIQESVPTYLPGTYLWN